MRRSQTALAEHHDMHIEFLGGIAFVTTVAGEWFFDYNQRPIHLHHKNDDLRLRPNGAPTSHYHIQEFTFETPMAAMVYIYRHERAAKQLTFEENMR